MSSFPPTGSVGSAGPTSSEFKVALVTVTSTVADIPLAIEALITVVPTALEITYA